mgnify:CR=1 FL=1
MFRSLLLSVLFVVLETLYAQAPKIIEKQTRKVELNKACYRDLFEKRFITENIYVSSSPSTAKQSLHHILQIHPLLSDFLYTKYQVSELALLKKTSLDPLFPKWDVSVLTPQYEYKKVFEHVLSPFPIIDVEKGFYIFIADSIKINPRGQFCGTFWLVSRDGVPQRIRKLDNVVPLDRGYFRLFRGELELLYHLYSDKQYVVPKNMEVYQCGVEGKILLKSRNAKKSFFIWSLETNEISPWHVDGLIRRFPNLMGGGRVVRADGASMVYAPDFHPIYEHVIIKELSFCSLSPYPSLSNNWVLLRLENQMVLLDCSTGKEILSAYKIEWRGSCYFEVETEAGTKKLINIVGLCQKIF